MMNEALPPALGPSPFRFAPSQPGRASPAFSLTFKTLATALTGLCAGWLALLWCNGALGAAGRNTGLVWMSAGLLLMLYTWWCILRSRTYIDAAALHQTWIWDKQLALADLAYCKLIRVRGLEWLIAPRLHARSLSGKFAVFYSANAALLADFERLAREVADFRRL